MVVLVYLSKRPTSWVEHFNFSIVFDPTRKEELTPKQAIHTLVPVITGSGLTKVWSTPRFFFVAVIKTTRDAAPATVQDDTDLGVSPPLSFFNVNNHRYQFILYV